VALKNGYQRKRMLIDKDFQFQYLLTWMGMTMALLAGLVLASVSMVFVFKMQSLDWLVAGNMLSAVVITGLSMRYMIKFSHRIAGPAYRLEKVIREVADGTYEGYVTMRKKDYLKHVAESVNYLIDKMDEKGHEVRALREQARELAETLQTQPSSSPEVKALAQSMVERLGEIAPTGTWESGSVMTDDMNAVEEMETVETQ
jgi:methyl-accepting chemotaxis protein